MSDQIVHVEEAYKKLTNVTRSSWGPMYQIRPERIAEEQKARQELEAEKNGLDTFSLTPHDQIRLRRAEEEYFVRTDPTIEMERRMAGGREF